MLLYPNIARPFYIKTDASNFAIGGVLTQKDDEGRERVIAYASRTLAKAEANWSASEKECLALVWSVDRFKMYIYGRRFFIITDHAALAYLKRQRDSNAKLMQCTQS